MSKRENYVYKAKLAEHAERFDEMVEAMKKVAFMHVELTCKEINLLWAGYSQSITAKRASWRIITTIEQQEANKSGKKRIKIIKAYRKQVQHELLYICSDILNLLEQHLLPFVKRLESKVFYYNIKGDLYRYLAEFATGRDFEHAVNISFTAYKTATDIAMNELPEKHSVRLGLALNFAVFYYEILQSPDRACRLAKAAIDDALSDSQTLSDNSKVIVQLLNTNIKMWTSNTGANGGGKQKKSLSFK